MEHLLQSTRLNNIFFSGATIELDHMLLKQYADPYLKQIIFLSSQLV